MGNKDLKKILIDFFNWYNDNPEEFSNNETIVDAYINSHSPDTLQEGDWFQGTKEEYETVIRIEGELELSEIYPYLSLIDDEGLCYFKGSVDLAVNSLKKTQLTPEEFIRRADNHFNNKNK